MVRKGFTKELSPKFNLRIILKSLVTPEKKENISKNMKSMSKTEHICGKSPKSRDIGDTYRMVGNKGRSTQRHSKSPNILKTLLKNLKSSPQHEPQASRMDAGCQQPLDLTSTTQLIINPASRIW